ncbi:MAG TPA: sodium/proton-translocating pyrophosphatase, partial [Spirochaetia bacterium]|nr:sodium/proton-translocating pyrophosphatase [Spirochaetia bacterium]
MTEILLIAFLGSLLALGYAVIQSLRISRIAVDNKNLERISGYIAEGARAFLNREYLVLLPFVVIVALFLLVANSGALRLQALAFFMGALFSALAGYFGMMVATKANARTAQQAEKGINHALRVAFAGGSVMGMTVVGLALLGITVLITLGMQLFGVDIGTFKNTIFPIVTGFSLGASTVALFARVGGGIFTKAAGVG